jgi:hypothetical protein
VLTEHAGFYTAACEAHRAQHDMLLSAGPAPLGPGPNTRKHLLVQLFYAHLNFFPGLVCYTKHLWSISYSSGTVAMDNPRTDWNVSLMRSEQKSQNTDEGCLHGEIQGKQPN